MGRRLALIIGNSIFRDPSLARLLTPDADVGALADVLLSPEIGAFDDVKLVVNMAAASIRRSISEFFSNKTRDDLLLLYFSGHGVLDENGRLYLATKETERHYLRGTAIPAAFITDEMDHSRSRRQVLVLDCCHSGAFARGSKGAPGASVGTATAFEGKGYGRVVLTASDATQYAWEGDQVLGEADNSVFTHYLVQGLQTGKADADGDGQITVDELYDYVYEQVISQTPRQTPGKWSYREQGEIVLARALAGAPPQVEEIQLPEFDDEIEAKLKRMYDTGLAAFWLDDWDRAARAFQAILDARPDYPGALEKLREARRNAELARLYQAAQDARQSQDWDAAVSALEALLAQAADYRDAASQLQSARQQARLAALYAEARRLQEAGEWYAARRVLASIAESDPDYADEDGLHALVAENIAALERQKQLEDLYSQALARIDAGKLDQARGLLSQVQELEPGYAESEALLAKVESFLQRQAEERQRQAEIDALYRQAQRLAHSKQWSAVVSKMEDLHRLSPEFEDPDDLLATAQRQLELAEQESRRQEETQASTPNGPARERIWPEAHPVPAQPASVAQPWYAKPITYLRQHIWLTLGASVFIVILVLVGLNAGRIFTLAAQPETSTKIGGTVSVLIVWEGSELESFQAMVAPFEERTGVTVEIESTRDLNSVLTSRVEGGNPPDVAGLPGPAQLLQFAETGDLQPLDQALNMEAMNAQYDPGFLQLATVDGQLYGIFIKAAVKSLIWYSPPAFEAADYEIPETWEQLNRLEDQIISNGVAPWCIGLESGAASGWPGTDWIEDIMLRTARPDVYDQWVNQELPWTDNTVKLTWEIWSSKVVDAGIVFGGPQTVLTTNFGEAFFPMFEDPPGCYLHRQANFITDFITDQFPDLQAAEDFNFFRFPPIQEEQGNPLLIAGDLFGMFNDTPQAQALMEWLVSAEAQSIWAERGGFISANKTVDPAIYPDPLTQQIGEMLAAADAVRFDGSDLMPSQMNEEFWAAVQDVVANPQSLDQILQRLEDVRVSLR